MPLVSVVVPYYEHAAYVGEAIASLLTQTIADVEVIAVDDASTDGGSEVVDRYSHDPRLIHIRRAKNEGPSAALNDGLLRATGRYVALQGGDDLSEPYRLEHQLRLIDARQADAVFSPPTMIDENGRELREEILPVFFGQPTSADPIEVTRRLFFQGNYFCAPTSLIRADAVREVGLFDRSLVQLQDYDYWLRMVMTGKRLLVGERRVTRYRRHKDNLSREENSEASQGELVRCLVRFLGTADVARLPRIFPEVFGLDSKTPTANEVAKLALWHSSPLIQSIGKAMILDPVRHGPARSDMQPSLDRRLSELLSVSGIGKEFEFPKTEYAGSIG